MLTGVVFCPQAPALVPGVGLGDDSDLDEIRAACRTAIQRVAIPGMRIVVLSGGDCAMSFGATSRGSFASYGADVTVALGSDSHRSDADVPNDLPASLAVGASLVRDALGPNNGATGAVVDAGHPVLPALDADVLVIVGDGSARRTKAGPGYLDERAEGFDARQAAALRSGHPAQLAPDAVLGAELLAAGVPVWTALAALPGRFDAELLYEGAPFGVGYFVAAWTTGATADA